MCMVCMNTLHLIKIEETQEKNSYSNKYIRLFLPFHSPDTRTGHKLSILLYRLPICRVILNSFFNYCLSSSLFNARTS